MLSLLPSKCMGQGFPLFGLTIENNFLKHNDMFKPSVKYSNPLNYASVK